MTEYIVWVGGTEIGTYDDEFDAEQVASDYRKDGYDDAVSEEVEVDDETPKQMNAWLLSKGF
jgi:hypothetical protein